MSKAVHSGTHHRKYPKVDMQMDSETLGFHKTGGGLLSQAGHTHTHEPSRSGLTLSSAQGGLWAVLGVWGVWASTNRCADGSDGERARAPDSSEMLKRLSMRRHWVSTNPWGGLWGIEQARTPRLRPDLLKAPYVVGPRLLQDQGGSHPDSIQTTSGVYSHARA